MRSRKAYAGPFLIFERIFIEIPQTIDKNPPVVYNIRREDFYMKKLKILFQGDSITDAGRDRSDPHNLAGYTAFAAERLREKMADVEFEFVNLGISGNTTADLLDRFDSDFAAIGADVVVLLIGINDVWRKYDSNRFVSPEEFSERYLRIVRKIKETGAKLVVLEPFLLPSPDKRHFRADLAQFTDAIRDAAAEYADGYVPLDGILAKARLTAEEKTLSADGVHPAPAGQYILGLYAAEEIIAVMKK